MNPPESTQDPIPLLYSLLGPDAVLLPLPPGKKSPTRAGWQNVTLPETQTPVYQMRLRQGNIGVLVGAPSNGLCSIDCDSDDVLETFLGLNPTLRNTLVTVGKRGGNVWVKVRGEYPRTKAVKSFGEWRATGGQTVVWGVHPDGPHYHFRNQAKVLSVEFCEIKWPDGFNFDRTGKGDVTPPHHPDSSVSPASVSESCIPETASCIPASVCIPVSLHQQAFTDAFSRLDRQNEIEARQDKWFAAPENARLAPLYRDLVMRYAAGEANRRNVVIVECGKRLFYAVSPAVALQLLTAFYEINTPLFKDTLEQHQREASAMLANCEATYRATLPEIERKFYLQLPDRLRPPYRIARDLAARDEPRSPKGQFFMSADGFGRRLGVSCAEGDRILKQLIALGIIRIVRPGEQRAAKKTPRSTEYAWLFPIEVISPPVPPVPPSEPDEDLFADVQTVPDELGDFDDAVFDQAS